MERTPHGREAERTDRTGTDLKAGRNGPQRWFFDVWSYVYDAAWVQRVTYHPVHDAVVDALRDARPRHLLDLGCGTGQLAARLAATFPAARVVGCDFSSGMLAHAAAGGAPIDLVQGDAGRLPFASGAFDVVVSTEAFHWFPDQSAALAECFRVLRPGGRLLVATVNMPAAALSRVVYLGASLVGEPFYWPSGRESRHWIEGAGFQIEQRQRVFRLGSPLLSAVLTCAYRPPSAPRRRGGVRERRADTRRPRGGQGVTVGARPPDSAPGRVRIRAGSTRARSARQAARRPAR